MPALDNHLPSMEVSTGMATLYVYSLSIELTKTNDQEKIVVY